MLKLEDIIDAKEGREIKRALAAKMVSEGFERRSSVNYWMFPILLSVNGKIFMKINGRDFFLIIKRSKLFNISSEE